MYHKTLIIFFIFQLILSLTLKIVNGNSQILSTPEKDKEDTLRAELIEYRKGFDQLFEIANVSKGHPSKSSNPVDNTKLEGRGIMLPPEVINRVLHKKHPPVIGSLCDLEMYERLFNEYYKIEYINFNDRLYEHKKIEKRLKEESDAELAWSICQYGGLKLQCGHSRRCECLNQKPPDRYIKEGNKCVGELGSTCTKHPEAPIDCKKGVDCEDGYCGGIEMAVRKISKAPKDCKLAKLALLFSIFSATFRIFM